MIRITSNGNAMTGPVVEEILHKGKITEATITRDDIAAVDLKITTGSGIVAALYLHDGSTEEHKQVQLGDWDAYMLQKLREEKGKRGFTTFKADSIAVVKDPVDKRCIIFDDPHPDAKLPCPECKGKGEIQLATSVVPCKKCRPPDLGDVVKCWQSNLHKDDLAGKILSMRCRHEDLIDSCPDPKFNNVGPEYGGHGFRKEPLSTEDLVKAATLMGVASHMERDSVHIRADDEGRYAGQWFIAESEDAFEPGDMVYMGDNGLLVKEPVKASAIDMKKFQHETMKRIARQTMEAMVAKVPVNVAGPRCFDCKQLVSKGVRICGYCMSARVIKARTETQKAIQLNPKHAALGEIYYHQFPDGMVLHGILVSNDAGKWEIDVRESDSSYSGQETHTMKLSPLNLTTDSASSCDECYGTGYLNGIGAPCSKGCKA